MFTEWNYDFRILERRSSLLAQIEEVRRTRALQRSARKRHGGLYGQGLATVAVIGYTNAVGGLNLVTLPPHCCNACNLDILNLGLSFFFCLTCLCFFFFFNNRENPHWLVHSQTVIFIAMLGILTILWNILLKFMFHFVLTLVSFDVYFFPFVWLVMWTLFFGSLFATVDPRLRSVILPSG